MTEAELMHGEVTVATIAIDGDGMPSRILGMRDLEHMPPGTLYEGEADIDELRDWWRKRSIPEERTGIGGFLEKMRARSAIPLATESNGFNLSDQYWVDDRSGVGWEDRNFFDNPFSLDVGDMLFGVLIDVPDIRSPDLCTDGVLMKRWIVEDGRRRLAKSGTGPACQEPFNEVIASYLMGALGIDHVGYETRTFHGRRCSVCDCFVKKNTELVTAKRFVDSITDTVRGTYDGMFLKGCEDLGIDSTVFTEMKLVDAIMLNTDRHLGNYGLIRDAETLEYIGPAPVYDTGTSLLCGYTTEGIVKCIPHAEEDAEKAVNGFDAGSMDVDGAFDILPKVSGMLRSGMDERRADAITGLLEARLSGASRALDHS